MKTFEKQLDLKDRDQMLNFLKNHFRYDTLNSWNSRKSYANNLKIYKLDLPSNIENALWSVLDCEDAYNSITELINNFNEEHDYKFQAGFNGRSGGYLVLYSGGLKDSGYKSYCPSCGQRNYQLVSDTNHTCGVCGAERKNYKKPPMTSFIQIHSEFLDIDNLEDLSDSELAERCKVVSSFDRLCDAIVTEAINLATNYKVVEEVISVPKTVRKLQAI